MSLQFKPAVRYESKLRLALTGPAGSGKTWTALHIARVLAGSDGRIALLDTEHGSAAKFANLVQFDHFSPDSFHPNVYMEAIKAAEDGGYVVLILDSLSHAWAGKDGVLELVDTISARSRSGNKFTTGWRDASPLHNRLVDSILAAKLHIIATMRVKMGYEMQVGPSGKSEPVKVGLEPIQRQGVEYEFDMVGDMDIDHNLIITKSRFPEFTTTRFARPTGEDIGGILVACLSGETPPPPPPQQKQPASGAKRPGSPHQVQEWLRRKAGYYKKVGDDWGSAVCNDEDAVPPSKHDFDIVIAWLDSFYESHPRPDDSDQLLSYLFRRQSAGSLTDAEIGAMLFWIADSDSATKEAESILDAMAEREHDS